MKPFHRLENRLTIVALALGVLSVQGATSVILRTSSAASALETLAAREIQRYAYVRTGQLWPVASGLSGDADRRGLILVARKDRAEIQPFFDQGAERVALLSLDAQGWWLKSVARDRRRVLVVAGGSETATLYAAYRLAELWGVRFYLHGDVAPDVQVRSVPLEVNERREPLFALRGIQPFHDFPEGPDWWNRDDYLAILSQLPKLKMNFFGLHTYPEGGPNAEPTVWIGPPAEIGEGSEVKASYPASYQNTLRGNWGYAAKPTSAFSHGAADLFERDDFGGEVMGGHIPEPRTPEGCNDVFARAGDLLRDAFAHARRLGIKTCVGTETPLTVPKALRERLQSEGKNPAEPAVLRELYTGVFRRAAQTYPLDYYWFWTPEGWTWEGTKDEQVKRTIDDLMTALAAAQDARVPFELATCGWVLGPQQDRALFDKVLPKYVAVSCINREVGRTPVDKGFLEVKDRGKWAIPWLEDDPALTSPQLWVGRMRRDAADARRYGCNGLMGIHWRTRVLGPAVSALAQAAWEQDAWNTGPSLSSPPAPAEGPQGGIAADFYADWAPHHFGSEVGPAAAEIFARIDGRLPRPADWVDGPGNIKPDARPWAQVASEYAFVDEFARLRAGVRGAGNQERFDYWLHTFQYLRAMGRLNCTWAVFNQAMQQVKAAPEATRRAELARTAALPLRRELISRLAEVYDHLLALVSNPGELGTIANWEQHILPGLIAKPGEELAQALRGPLPEDALPPHRYRGPTRVIVPTVRSAVAPNEALRLKVLVLSDEPPKEAALFWRSLGQGRYRRVPLEPVARGVHTASFVPASRGETALEYYVKVTSRAGKPVHFPATAPKLNQTVVVQP